jgi:hypothetical protein
VNLAGLRRWGPTKGTWHQPSTELQRRWTSGHRPGCEMGNRKGDLLSMERRGKLSVSLQIDLDCTGPEELKPTGMGSGTCTLTRRLGGRSRTGMKAKGLSDLGGIMTAGRERLEMGPHLGERVIPKGGFGFRLALSEGLLLGFERGEESSQVIGCWCGLGLRRPGGGGFAAIRSCGHIDLSDVPARSQRGKEIKKSEGAAAKPHVPRSGEAPPRSRLAAR